MNKKFKLKFTKKIVFLPLVFFLLIGLVSSGIYLSSKTQIFKSKAPKEDVLAVSSQSSLLTAWKKVADLPQPMGAPALFLAKGYIFHIGLDPEAALANPQTLLIYSAKIQENGNLGTWQRALKIPSREVEAPTTAVYRMSNGDEWVFFVSTMNKEVRASKVNDNGTLNPWIKITSLPGDGYTLLVLNQSIVAAHNHLFLIGEKLFLNNRRYVQAAYSAKINSDGTLGSWTEVAAPPNRRLMPALATDGNYLFTGGGDDGNDTNINTRRHAEVYSAKINSDGTLNPWRMVKPMPRQAAEVKLVVVNGYIFTIGGLFTPQSADPYSVYAAKINNDGSLENWFYVNNLPQRLNGHGAISDGRNIYVAGGMVYTEMQSNVYSAAFTPNPVETPGDFNNDGRLDLIDMSVLASQWGATESSRADLNHDRTVDQTDLDALVHLLINSGVLRNN